MRVDCLVCHAAVTHVIPKNFVCRASVVDTHTHSLSLGLSVALSHTHTHNDENKNNNNNGKYRRNLSDVSVGSFASESSDVGAFPHVCVSL